MKVTKKPRTNNNDKMVRHFSVDFLSRVCSLPKRSIVFFQLWSRYNMREYLVCSALLNIIFFLFFPLCDIANKRKMCLFHPMPTVPDHFCLELLSYLSVFFRYVSQFVTATDASYDPPFNFADTYSVYSLMVFKFMRRQ